MGRGRERKGEEGREEGRRGRSSPEANPPSKILDPPLRRKIEITGQKYNVRICYAERI